MKLLVTLLMSMIPQMLWAQIDFEEPHNLKNEIATAMVEHEAMKKEEKEKHIPVKQEEDSQHKNIEQDI